MRLDSLNLDRSAGKIVPMIGGLVLFGCFNHDILEGDKS